MSDSYNNLSYIQEVAANSRTETSTWDILAIFADDKFKIEMPRKEINKRFFAPRIPKEFIGAAQDKKEEKQKRKHDVAKVFGGSIQNVLRTLEPVMQEKEDIYNNRFAEMTAARNEYFKLYMAHRAISSKDENGETIITKQLAEIEDTGLFEFVKYHETENTFEFKTVNPFAINVQKKFSETIRQIPLGHWTIKVNYLTMNVFLKNQESNHKEFRYTHPAPFVGRDGKMCFGDEIKRVDKFIKDRDLPGLMRLVYDIMSSYEEGVQPYMRIDQYLEQYKRIMGVKPIIEEYKKTKTIPPKYKQRLGIFNYESFSDSRQIAYDFENGVFAARNRITTVPCCKNHINDCTCRTEQTYQEEVAHV
jgi:hypothetical protein